MKLNLNKEKAYEIADKYINRYDLIKHSFKDIEKQVTFYESIFDVKGAAWVVANL